jgi:hypothetical protein
MIASRSTTFEQFATAIDDAFARWDRNHLHEFTFADGTPVSPASTWDGDEREGTLDGSKARLGRLRLASSSPTSSTSATTGSTCAPSQTA